MHILPEAFPAFNLTEGIKLFMLAVLPSSACPKLCQKMWLIAAKLPHVFIRRRMHQACQVITRAVTFVNGCQKNIHLDVATVFSEGPFLSAEPIKCVLQL